MKPLTLLVALLVIGCRSTRPGKLDPSLYPNQEAYEKAQAEYDGALLAAYLLSLAP